jgi:hypothetical protein
MLAIGLHFLKKSRGQQQSLKVQSGGVALLDALNS